MAVSAFIVRVPEAEPCVGALRERFDASVKLGVPSHITVLAPFMPPQLITTAVLRRAQQALSAVPAFSFSLSQVHRFPATAYLAPEPVAPFIALTKSLVHEFPEYPPFAGEFETIIPHLTVAHGNATDAEVAAVELAVALHTYGPIAGTCALVALLENSSGFWKELHAFPLAGTHNGG
jgi:hypothetical protein